MSMWMSHHREWKEGRQCEKEAAFRSYTSGIWEFDEEPRPRSNAEHHYSGSGLHNGGCRVSPAVGGVRMMAYVADGGLCRCWVL